MLDLRDLRAGDLDYGAFPNTAVDTLIEAAEHVETVVPEGEIKEVVADKGYHSNQVMVDLEAR